jgi:putative hemolysin
LSNPALEVLIIFLLLVANGVFAMSEIAIVSARKARLQQLAEAGDAQARAALELASRPTPFLASVQIGITLISILAGAFGGATLAKEIAARLNTYPALAPYGETIGVGIVVLSLTYFSLVIGELAPKRLALSNPERIASAVAAPMQALSRLAAPVVHLLSVSTDVVIRMLGVKPSAEPVVTPEEIKILIEQGTASGVFEEVEQEMIESVLRLDERRAGALMTPRTQIVWFDLEDTAEIIRLKVGASQHSRFPVIKDSLDNVLGIVRAKDLLAQSLSGQPLDLKALLRPPLFIPESMSALRVLGLFKEKGTHIALVTDEYGGIQGMVTHNDILEAVVGVFSVPGGPTEPQVIRREDGSWLLDGMLHVDQLKELFDLEKLPDEDHGHYHTVGGFVLTQMRRIPSAGQRFEWGKLSFEIVDMDGRRIDKILVTPLPASPDSETR